MPQTTFLTEKEVHRRVEQQIRTWFGDGAILQRTDPDIRRLERSFFVRYEVKLGTKCTAVLLKVPRPGSATTFLEALHSQRPRPSTLREYDILVACEKRISETEPRIFCAVRPLAYFPEWNAIAMEELNSVPLSAGKFRMPFQNLEELLHRAGRWLRMFHDELGSPSHHSLTQVELVYELEEKLQILRTFNNSETKMNRLRRLFRSQFRSFQVVVPYVELHGDFKLANILIDAEARVGSLDSKMRRRGVCYKDLAKLYADLIGDRLAMLTAGLINKPLRWQRSLLNGYFQSDSYNESIFKIYAALALLDKWIRNEGQASARSLVIKPVRPLFRRYFFQLLTQILTFWMILLNSDFDFPDLSLFC